MARVTVEDCLKAVPNRFALVILASKRAKQLLNGAKPLVNRKNKEVIISLREVAAGKVVVKGADELRKEHLIP